MDIETKKQRANREWYQTHKEWNRAKSRNYHRAHPEVTRFYSVRRRAVEEKGFPFTITHAEFSEWFLRTPQRCEYCDLVELCLDSKTRRGTIPLTLSIDRKDSAQAYTLENMCFSCWTCNRLKSDIFTYSEWKEIAQKYIKPKWLARLGVPSI